MANLKSDALWHHLYWLTVLAEQKSFTRAAERLEVSKAAFSQKIKELETEVGIALVSRTTRSVRLTSAGEKLVAELQQPFADIQKSFFAIRDMKESVQGLIRITAPVAFARQQLLPCLNEFLKSYPQVRIQLEVEDRIVPMVNEGFDIAIRHTNNLPETSIALPLCSTRTLLVASKAYLAAHGVPRHPNDLSAHDCLYYPRGTELPRWIFEEIANPMSQLKVNVKGPLATNNSESIRDAALSGMGIAMLPDFSARVAIEEGQLEEVLMDWRIIEAFADKIWILRPYTIHPPRAVLVFSRWLQGRFGITE
ncbi:LysR family transcriptional regulator [Serratia sp. M24T3]|uniref:LysR family transcriptional regulator n=1 Tax=Serratia sp. M24T3 TaxID=932213 RepID=UPI00025B9F42|nr:LysR family transcriptional regulator [Serratia sp. M24T3]EIC84134.1 RuBisCO transcriptional regulator [Serratia sp. M24T3]